MSKPLLRGYSDIYSYSVDDRYYDFKTRINILASSAQAKLKEVNKSVVGLPQEQYEREKMRLAGDIVNWEIHLLQLREINDRLDVWLDKLSLDIIRFEKDIFELGTRVEQDVKEFECETNLKKMDNTVTVIE